MNQASISTYKNHNFNTIKEKVYQTILKSKEPVTLLDLTLKIPYSLTQIGRRVPELLRDGVIKIVGHKVINRRHYSLYVIATESERLDLIEKQFKADFYDWIKESEKFDQLMSTNLIKALKEQNEW